MILPLLIPGLAGSVLLLFVESLADLGNPMFIAGNTTVLSTQIFISVIGEYDYQKAAALSFVLLIPTLVVFLVQRYYVNRRSYISVTGKPTSGMVIEKSPLIRWFSIAVTYITCVMIVLLYATVVYSSFATAWRMWRDSSGQVTGRARSALVVAPRKRAFKSRHKSPTMLPAPPLNRYPTTGGASGTRAARASHKTCRDRYSAQ